MAVDYLCIYYAAVTKIIKVDCGALEYLIFSGRIFSKNNG
jgi:hypothetical protein